MLLLTARGGSLASLQMLALTPHAMESLSAALQALGLGDRADQALRPDRWRRLGQFLTNDKGAAPGLRVTRGLRPASRVRDSNNLVHPGDRSTAIDAPGNTLAGVRQAG